MFRPRPIPTLHLWDYPRDRPLEWFGCHPRPTEARARAVPKFHTRPKVVAIQQPDWSGSTNADWPWDMVNNMVTLYTL